MMTPEEEREATEAARVAEVERQFARKKPRERFFQPVNAMTAYGMLPPEVVRAVTGAQVEREEPEEVDR
jgi:hypothetical protein